MFKTLTAALLSATLAIGTLSPAPARAGNEEDIAKLLFGVGIAALLAKAINDQAEAEKRKEVHVHRHITKVQPVAPKPNRHITPHGGGSGWVKQVHRVVPSSCQRTFRYGGETRVFLPRRCLERAGVRTASLPNQCERLLDMPGNTSDRRVWGRGCLERNGYRMR